MPARRGTTYELLRVYDKPEDDEDSPLDHVTDAATRFGSYRRRSSTSGQFRYPAPVEDGGTDPLLVFREASVYER